MKNIEFIILSCDKYLTTRVSSIRETWGYNQNIKFLTDSKSDLNDVIGYDTPQNYEGILEKYKSFFINYDFSKYDYFFFTDDDTFVNLKNLNKLQLPNPETPFGLVRLLCLNPNGTDMWGNYTGADLTSIKGENTDLPLYYPSGGSGFILSKTSCLLVQNYLKSCKNIPSSLYSDTSVGFWLRNCNVNLISSQQLWWDTHDNLIKNSWEKYNSDNDIITFHYVNPDLMRQYNQKYNQ